MKKILLGIIMVLSLVILPSDVSASNKVTVYIFRGSTCSHCEEALTYINKHKDEIDENIQIVTYEVWDNTNNAKLQEALGEKLKLTEKQKGNVPFIVIGEKYLLGFSGVSTFNKIKKTAESYIESDEYLDVVAETVKEIDVDVEALALSDLISEPNKVVTIVVYSVFGLLVLGLICMIVFSRK